MRVATLLARHGTAKYAGALADVEALFARQMSEVTHDIVVIDNALPPDREEQLDTGAILIGGCNAAWEFSAWDRGIEFLGARLESYDFIHLATSAYRQLYVRYLDRFDAAMLGLARGRAVAVGHVDCYGEPVALLGRVSQAWLRTSFVFLRPAELRLLGSLVSVTDRGMFFSGSPDAPFRQDAPLSDGYRTNILGWLTGEGTGQGMEWHSRFRLTGDTIGLFEDKTIAILNEQMLSNRLAAQGCAIVDATWLATQARGARLGLSLGTVPSWRLQVTTRDVDAAPLSLTA